MKPKYTIGTFTVLFKDKNMMALRVSRFLLLAALFVGAGFILSSGKPGKMKQKTAVKQAEDFIRRNGYTEAPLDTATTPLTYESIEATLDIRTLLNARRASLHPSAYCVLHDSAGWHIGFLSTIVDMSTLDAAARKTDLPGRTVTVPDDGSEFRVEQKDPRFSLFKKLK